MCKTEMLNHRLGMLDHPARSCNEQKKDKYQTLSDRYNEKMEDIRCEHVREYYLLQTEQRGLNPDRFGIDYLRDKWISQELINIDARYEKVYRFATELFIKAISR